MPKISLDSFDFTKYYDYGYTLQLNMSKDTWRLESMQVQIARDPQFQQLVYDEVKKSYEISNYLTVDVGPLQGTFYARVKVTDKAGNESAFTPARVIFSSSVEDSISNIYANKHTRDTLEWWWTKSDSMNAFEVQVQDENGAVVLPAQRLGNVNHFVYHPQNAADGQAFYFIVRGSTDNGATWGAWSEQYHGYTLVDAIAPPIKFNQFIRENENAFKLEYSIDSTDHLVELQIQIAKDNGFRDIIYDKTTIAYPSNNQQSFIYNENFPEQQYYARVKVFDFAGNESEFTPAVRMTEDLSIPDFAAFSRTINTTPQWWWTQNEKVGNHEVEVLDQNGALIEQGATGEERRFVFGKPFEHGESFSARVRGESAFNGERGEWSAYSVPMMVDFLGAPSAQLSSFIHPRANTVEFKYDLVDDLSPLGYLKIEVATEPKFENLVFDKIISATSNPSVYQTPLSEPGDLYTRIAVIDAAGNVSPYSDIAQVDTVMTSTPVIYSGASYTKNAPSWIWSDVYNTNAYEIEIWNNT